MLVSILQKYPPNRKDQLLPLLQEVQSTLGFLNEETLTVIGNHLDLPINKVFGVASFYDQFRFIPLGKFHIKICHGTACHLYGSSSFLGEIEKQLRVKAGNVSKDRRYSLEVTNCMGGCDSAPVIRVNEEFFTRVSPEELTRILKSLKEKADNHGNGESTGR
jgi:NADH-quinone oxidoreductase subunit E